MSAGSNKLKYEYVKEYIEDKQCVLISKEYINAKEKLKIEFDCGHVSLISFECFKRGQRCSCDKEKRFKSTIEFKTREKILGSLRTSNFKFISFENNTASWDNKLTYECDKGHIETKGIREFMRFKHCVTCHNIFLSESQKGSMGNNWKGGKTRLTLFANKALVQWKKDSMKNCDYRCVITGDRFDDIHHLYPLNKILQEALDNLNLNLFEFTGDYTEENTKDILNELIRLHMIYPLGVCLRKDIHKMFHKLYGLTNGTPEDFYDFQRKIISGKIQIQ